jgi:P-type Cu2+ transporter
MSQAHALPQLVAGPLAAFVQRGADGIAELNLAVENMHCAGCLARIEGALRATPGVVEARANLSTRRVRLSFDPRLARAEALVDRVAGLGYRVAPFDPGLLADRGRVEERRLLVSLAVAGFAAGNVMLLSVALWAGGDMGPATRALFHWLSALIAMPAVAYAGRPFFAAAWAALRGGGLNMEVPISLAVLLGTGMSLHQTVVGAQDTYFDASVTLLFFLLIGRYLDRRARAKANTAAEQLMLLGAVAATEVLPDGSRRQLAIGQVRPGMRVFVAPGDRVPVDGNVAEGQSAIDTSLVSGEGLPREVGPGARVHAGTLNLSSPIEVTVAAAGEATLLAEIVRLMEAAEQGRARYVRLADRVARLYAPAVHLLAAATLLGWLALAVPWQVALLNAIAVLIVTCPCALGLAVPAVQVVASGRLLRHGVLVKSGDGLERLAQADHVVLDKTGTLTLGRPELVDAQSVPGELLSLAARLARASRHPLARAVVRAAGPVAALEKVRESPGMGLEAMLDGRRVRLGNRRWCAVETDAPHGSGPELWLSVEDASPYCFRFEDRLRPDAAEVVAALAKRGLTLELISGDREPAARAVAEALGIARWRAEATPAEKAARLADLADQGFRTVMLGDGLNDAPALAMAHASISPAEAADVSRTAADFVFQGDCLAPVLTAFEVARGADRLVRQNFALALLYNAIAVPLAVAGLVTPLLAAVAMSASSLLVTGNALRLGLDKD